VVFFSGPVDFPPGKASLEQGPASPDGVCRRDPRPLA
jgi:hypothetical protein